MKTKADITDAAVTVYLDQLLSFRRHIWIRDGLWWNPFVTFLCNKVCLKQNPLECCITHFPCYKVRQYSADKEVAQRTFWWEGPTVNVTVHIHTLAHILSLSHTLSHAPSLTQANILPPPLSLTTHTVSHTHTHSVSHTLFSAALPPHTQSHSHTPFACIHTTHTHTIFCMHTQTERDALSCQNVYLHWWSL